VSVTTKGNAVESIGTLNMVGLGLAAIGPGIGVGLIFAAFVTGVARQPEAEGKLRQIAILGFVLAEQFFIIGLALAFVLKSSNT
jgi:F-type H+-transporting ATPase subunit c